MRITKNYRLSEPNESIVEFQRNIVPESKQLLVFVNNFETPIEWMTHILQEIPQRNKAYLKVIWKIKTENYDDTRKNIRCVGK